MSRLLTALLCSCVACPAIAQQLYRPAWLGLYAGANVGYGNGLLGGGQAGYNWQNDYWILGVEGDMAALGRSGNAQVNTSTGHQQCCNDDFNFVDSTTAIAQWRNPWLTTLRFRAGSLLRDDVLVYMTAGVAASGFDAASTGLVERQMYNGPPDRFLQTKAGPPLLVGHAEQAGSATAWGWTAGAGIEKKITAQWSVELEYLHVDLGKHPVLIGGASGGDVHLTDDLARIGLNYAFWPW